MSRHICRLIESPNGLVFETDEVNVLGKILPKDGHTYRILLRTDNPDIVSLKTEGRLIRQALKEYEKRLPYNIKVWTRLPFPWDNSDVDVTIDFIEPDAHMSDNTLAYAGFPFGSLRGIMKFNNKFAWLDGHTRTGAELRALGIILPGMIDTRVYKTYSVRQTIKHEFGHILGLPHDDAGVMQAIYQFFNTMLSPFSLSELKDKYGLRSITGRWLKWIIAVMTRRQKFG